MLTWLISALCCSLIQTVTRSAADTVDVISLLRAPVLDGQVGTNEYGAPTLHIATPAGAVRVWVVRHEGFVYVAADLPDTTFYWGDDFVVSLDADGFAGPSPGVNDRQWYLRRTMDSSVVSVVTSPAAGRWRQADEESARLGPVRHDRDWDVATSSLPSGWAVELRVRADVVKPGAAAPRLALRTYNNKPHGWWSWPRAPTGVPAQRVERMPDLWAPLRLASAPPALINATQLVVVTTAGWDSTAGELRRFVRDGVDSPWRDVGQVVPIVVGRTGLAWGIGFDRLADRVATAGPRKHEGDGRSPAGIFPLETAFGFAPADSMHWVRLPYLALTPNIECVDDTSSVHYNTVVDRSAVPRVDWQSAERMRQIAQYQLGVIIGYNAAPPVKARGSCIFFHIWGGPRSSTVGCTALDATELAQLVAWLDPRARPAVVQVPAAVYPHVRAEWGLPPLER
jgi:D-alanyl-D-alanine dipeptidase